MEDIPLPLGLAMILGIIIKVALDRFDRVDGSAMTEDGVVLSKPPKYQLLSGGLLIFIGLVTLWLGCRRWINHSFSDDDLDTYTHIVIQTIYGGPTALSYFLPIGAGSSFLPKASKGSM